ncbi:hypothetical protein EDB83DRAFT_1838464 [Lactarius deliciosus]|nr:hypothetical protein EDB83DRAFT_1838464 [Lactarius deliciosus]
MLAAQRGPPFVDLLPVSLVLSLGAVPACCRIPVHGLRRRVRLMAVLHCASYILPFDTRVLGMGCSSVLQIHLGSHS